MFDLSSAALLAEGLLADALPRRWRHVQAVAAKAARTSAILTERDRPVVEAAAWLHDVGYAPDLVRSGLHALDGARWLRDNGFDDRVAALVAYHSCAIYEAREIGLAEVLIAEFECEESATADVLWYSDMTTGPDAQDMDILARLAEINERYGPDHPVTRFWRVARDPIVSVVRRVEAQLVGAQPM